MLILLSAKIKKRVTIKAYLDNDFAGDKNTRISITGYVIYLQDASIALKSKLQQNVTLSSSEAEYVALSETAMELVFIKNVVEFLQQTIIFATLIINYGFPQECCYRLYLHYTVN